MALIDDLQSEVDKILDTAFIERDGQKVPEPENVKLGNDAVRLDATVLYADMADSTQLVKSKKWWFAAKVYKAYLVCACRIIRDNGGVITAFDGDRVMAVFIGDTRNVDAVRSALRIQYVVKDVISPKLNAKWDDANYTLKQYVGIDTSEVYAVRTGIRGSNDLVWVGTSANLAAKMCAFNDGYWTHISSAVHDDIDDSVKIGRNKQSIWTTQQWASEGKTLYRTSGWQSF